MIGTGGVGLNSVQGARLVGASPIVALDLADDKREAALRFGATHAFDPRDGDLAAKIKATNHGRLVDWVFVTVGAKPAFDQANGLMKKGGAVVVVGMPPSGVMGSYRSGLARGGLPEDHRLEDGQRAHPHRRAAHRRSLPAGPAETR